MFDSIVTFFYSLLIFLASVLPVKNVGFAIIVMACITFGVSYVFAHLQFKHRTHHQLINQRISKLFSRTHENVKTIYETFMYTPWKGLVISLVNAFIFIFFFYIATYAITISPGDVSHVYFSLALIPQTLNYSFMGINITTVDYPITFMLFFGFMMFINMFLHMFYRIKYEKENHVGHFMELVFILFLVKIFLVVFRNFPFGALLYWGTHIVISLVLELIYYKKMTSKMSDQIDEKASLLSAEESKNKFNEIHGFFHKLAVRYFAKKHSMTKDEAFHKFHKKMYGIHHHILVEIIRYHLISHPYLISFIFLAIIFMWK